MRLQRIGKGIPVKSIECAKSDRWQRICWLGEGSLELRRPEGLRARGLGLGALARWCGPTLAMWRGLDAIRESCWIILSSRGLMTHLRCKQFPLMAVWRMDCTCE